MSRIAQIILIVVVVGIAGFFVARWLIERVSPMPDNLGVQNGRLTPCPSSPNCVSTFDTDAQHGMQPLRYEGETDAARARLLNIVEGLPNTTIISEQPNYVHIEFRSRLWRFIDDVEFYLPQDENVVHFRSASRLGYGDGGVNRARMEQIQQQFTTPN